MKKLSEDELLVAVKPYTKLDYSRLDNLYNVASYLQRERIDGAFVECGTMNGGSAGLIASVGQGRQVWLFDSWEGLPEPTKYDVKSNGEIGNKGRVKGSRDKVEELLFNRLQLDKNRIYLIEGWFKDTIPCCIDDIGKIALLHLDCDWYESVKLCLNSLYGSVVKGGFIIVDDYIDWEGCKKAVDEFIGGVMMAGRVMNIQKGSR